jgi:hypothetical protein
MAVRAGSDCVGDSVATAISKTLQAMYLQIRSAPSLRNGDAFPQHSQTPFAKSKTHATTSALRTYCEVIISVVRGFWLPIGGERVFFLRMLETSVWNGTISAELRFSSRLMIFSISPATFRPTFFVGLEPLPNLSP